MFFESWLPSSRLCSRTSLSLSLPSLNPQHLINSSLSLSWLCGLFCHPRSISLLLSTSKNHLCHPVDPTSSLSLFLCTFTETLHWIETTRDLFGIKENESRNCHWVGTSLLLCSCLVSSLFRRDLCVCWCLRYASYLSTRWLRFNLMSFFWLDVSWHRPHSIPPPS